MIAFREEIAKLLDVLAINKDELIKINVEPFRIELLDNRPSYERAMRYNRKLTEFIDIKAKTLYKKGLIKESNFS